MPDPGNPDQDPKPGNPEPGKGAFGWYKPPTEPPRKLNLGDSQPHQDQAPTRDQETLFRAAAIKCAEMEVEIAYLVTQILDKAGEDIIELGDSDKWNFKPITIQRYGSSGLSISEDDSKITNSDGQKTRIAFTESSNPYQLEDWTENPAGTGFSSHYRLGINTNTDLRLGDYLDRLKKVNPSVRTNLTTEYFFTAEGGYRKHISFTVPNSIGFDPDDRFIVISDDDEEDGNFFSGLVEMTAEDFELAGQALSLLKKRLINPNWDQELQEEKPAE